MREHEVDNPGSQRSEEVKAGGRRNVHIEITKHQQPYETRNFGCNFGVSFESGTTLRLALLSKARPLPNSNNLRPDSWKYHQLAFPNRSVHICRHGRGGTVGCALGSHWSLRQPSWDEYREHRSIWNREFDVRDYGHLYRARACR